MKNSFGQKIFSNLLAVLAQKEFCRKALLIKAKYDIPNKITKHYFAKYEQKISDCIIELDKLAGIFGLHDNYGMLLAYFLVFSEMPDEKMLNKIKPFEMIDCEGRNGLKCCAIKIYPETTKKDIYDNWPIIAKRQKEIYNVMKIKRPKKKALRDLLMGALKTGGATNRQVKNKINEIFPKEILAPEDIAKIIYKNERRVSKIISKNK